MATGLLTETKDMVIKAERFISKSSAPTEITTAGAATYTTAQISGRIILRDPSGSSRTDTMPTAALLVAMYPNPEIGDTHDVMVINTADAAETITIQAGSGGAFASTIPAAAKVIAQNSRATLRFRITAVASGSEAYVLYM